MFSDKNFTHPSHFIKLTVTVKLLYNINMLSGEPSNRTNNVKGYSE